MQVPDSTRPLLRQIEAIQEIECQEAARLELETTPGLRSTIKSVTPNAFEYIPEELIQHIQSHLPVKEAARTTVLSKSWRHAWSTNPTLRFRVRGKKSLKLVDRTLKRYLRDNISIEKLDLEIDIDNRKSAYRAEKCIRPFATKTCLKEFSLLLTFLDWDSHFTLPDELLLSENLTKIRFEARTFRNDDYNIVSMTTSLHPVIKCVSLRELDLHYVEISGEALNHILSSCTLLVKIQLIYLVYCASTPENTIIVKNLPCLRELHTVFFNSYSPSLEISDVPNLHVFRYNLNGYLDSENGYMHGSLPFKANAHTMSLRNVRELELRGVVPDYVSLDMITSGFPFLESLTLDLNNSELERFHFTCASIKIFSLVSHQHNGLYDVQIFAPKLLSFSFKGYNIPPNLLFPISSLRKMELSFTLLHPVDVSIFVKMREALTIAPKCNICISTYNNFNRDPLDIDMDDLRRRLLLPPATNVQQLDFQVYNYKCQQQRSPFFEAFFEICHPKHVYARQDWSVDDYFLEKNHFCSIMLSEVLEKKKTNGYWPDHQKHVLVKLLPNEEWEPLTNSNKSLLDGSSSVCFKLEWA